MESLKSSGHNVVYKNSFKGVFLSARARYVFLTCGNHDVTHYALTRNSIKILLWHGIPLKKIRADDCISKSGALVSLSKYFWMKIFSFDKEEFDYIVTSSEKVSNRLRTAFEVDDDSKFLKIGYPRNDIDASKRRLSKLDMYLSCGGYDKVICYAPTHRGEGGHPMKFPSVTELEKLTRMLKSLNACFLVKPHFYHYDEVNEVMADKVDNILAIDSEIAEDMNLLLPYVDLLITDYSSVFYDYLLFDKPIVFFPYDLNEYLSKDRELYEDYFEATPGPKYYSWNDLIKNIPGLFQSDGYAKERTNLSKEVYLYRDCDNSRRLVDLILSNKLQ